MRSGSCLAVTTTVPVSLSTTSVTVWSSVLTATTSGTVPVSVSVGCRTVLEECTDRTDCTYILVPRVMHEMREKFEVSYFESF